MASHADPPNDAPPGPSGLLTVAEAAGRAGVSRRTVAGWVAGGRLPAVLVGGRRRVRPADLAAAQAAAHLGAVVPAWRADPRRAGRRLRALREAAGLTQLDLAAASGLAHETVSRLELGRQAARVETVRKLARALGVAPATFVAPGALATGGLTLDEAAVRLGVPPGRVRTWLAAGKLPGTKASGEWRVPAAALAALEASGRLRGRSRRLDPRFRG